MFSLNNKTAVITGGGSGIGKAIAKMFARQGAVVHILELNTAAAAEAVNEIIADGGRVTSHICDVSQQDQVIDTFNTIGSFNISVNNAGISHVGTAVSTTEKDFDRIVAINVKGVYNCLHAAIPLLQKNNGGVIVNMCSVAATLGLADRFAYSMSKGAVLSMTLSVAKDYLNNNIRCNSISPARVHTPFIDGFLSKNYPGNEAEMFQKLSATQPIGRMGTPEEVAAMALYLCSDEAAFITGNDYAVDGGFITLNNK